MSERAVNLPAREQERQAILALIAFAVLAIIGTASLLAAVGIGLVKAFQWAFPGVLV